MNCAEMLSWLDGYVDEELDLARSVEVERHLAVCADCAAQIQALRKLRSMIARNAPYHTAPAELRKRVESLMPRPKRHPLWKMAWMPAAAALAASLATVLIIGVRPSNTIEQQVVASHYRSLLANHLTDVASSDRHTVKPWFTGKLDFGADVFDLSGSGFPLAGGRLDYIDGRTVAALVYNRGRHVINVFVWPESGSERAPRFDSARGYNVVHWSAAGMAWWAVSDVNAADLKELAGLLIAAEEKK
jgi:mycothiol system anti-sigma-R factor